jgi:hypothetical protein
MPKRSSTIAQRIKFRPKSVIALPVEKKARHLSRSGRCLELVRRAAARRLPPGAPAADDGRRSSMRSAFAHEEGLIKDEAMEAPPRSVSTSRERPWDAQVPGGRRGGCI